MQQYERFIEEYAKSDETQSLKDVTKRLGRKSMNGAVRGATNLEMIEFQGRGLYRITTKGKKFNMSSNLGSVVCMENLGELYSSHAFDYERAEKWFLEAFNKCDDDQKEYYEELVKSNESKMNNP